MPQSFGTFKQYRPAPIEMPEWVKGTGWESSVVFARNESGEDWYTTVKKLPTGKVLVTLWAGTNNVASVSDDYEDWPVPNNQEVFLLDPKTEAIPAMGDWWSPVGAAAPQPGPPELSPRQFEWLLAYSGLEDIWDAVRDGAKGQGNMKLYADLRAQERAGEYFLEKTLAFKNSPVVKSVITSVAPRADLSDARITTLWYEAAAQTFDTIG